jgi:hypothetical protein
MAVGRDGQNLIRAERGRKRKRDPTPNERHLHAPHSYQPDPVDLGTHSDLIGAPGPTSIEGVVAAPNGGFSTAQEMLHGVQPSLA